MSDVLQTAKQAYAAGFSHRKCSTTGYRGRAFYTKRTLAGVLACWCGASVAVLFLPLPTLAQAGSSSQWRSLTAEETDAQWDYVLNSPLGIAALNQLAIEGFISPVCTKQFYTNEEYGGFQTLLQITCPAPCGASTARGYDEMRVIFNRFESNIENFEVRRVYPDQQPEISLPE